MRAKLPLNKNCHTSASLQSTIVTGVIVGVSVNCYCRENIDPYFVLVGLRKDKGGSRIAEYFLVRSLLVLSHACDVIGGSINHLEYIVVIVM